MADLDLYDLLKKVILKDIDINRLEEICNAEREGRCVVLPCKIGDVAYHLLKSGYIAMTNVASIHDGIDIRGRKELYVKLRSKNTGYVSWKVKISEFGRTVFLTREEAEKALEDLNHGKH